MSGGLAFPSLVRASEAITAFQSYINDEAMQYRSSALDSIAQGHPEELINTLRSLATPSRQLINTLLRRLRHLATINKR